MAKGFHKTQLDMFRESARRTQTYFQLDWPSDCKPLASFPVDAVTPWYQVKMQAMSALERQATIAILEMNANKPVSTPFTLDDFCAQSTLSLTLRFRKSIRGGVMKKQEASRRDSSTDIAKLEKIGVLRCATEEETRRYGYKDKRQKLYVFADPHVETWYRERNARSLYPAHKSPNTAPHAV